LAEKSKVSRTVISQLENGKRDIITSDTMKNIADALGEPVGNIFLF
ncbi:MAG: helix-turn-helix transcriptional regulator, partial [[Eubacterium] sulci]|nr:helix-turn-helix transcriptional regulator [[Eubacterium] sulci]